MYFLDNWCLKQLESYRPKCLYSPFESCENIKLFLKLLILIFTGACWRIKFTNPINVIITTCNWTTSSKSSGACIWTRVSKSCRIATSTSNNTIIDCCCWYRTSNCWKIKGNGLVLMLIRLRGCSLSNIHYLLASYWI